MGKRVKPIASPDTEQAFSATLLGQAVRAKRTQSQLRLEDAAALCGVAKQTLANIEHGEQTCQLGSVLQVCKGLGLKLQILPWQDESEVNDDWC